MTINSLYNFNFSIYILYTDNAELPGNLNRPSWDPQRDPGCVRERKLGDVPRSRSLWWRFGIAIDILGDRIGAVRRLVRVRRKLGESDHNLKPLDRSFRAGKASLPAALTDVSTLHVSIWASKFMQRVEKWPRERERGEGEGGRGRGRKGGERES